MQCVAVCCSVLHSYNAHPYVHSSGNPDSHVRMTLAGMTTGGPGAMTLSQKVKNKLQQVEWVAVCCSSMLQRVATWCSVLRCGAVWCSVVQCGAVWCSVVQYDAVWCSVVQFCVVPCGAVW